MFPLGMYGVGGHYLGQADHLPIVKAIGADESWIALIAWALTFAAMLHYLTTARLFPLADLVFTNLARVNCGKGERFMTRTIQRAASEDRAAANTLAGTHGPGSASGRSSNRTEDHDV